MLVQDRPISYRTATCLMEVKEATELVVNAKFKLPDRGNPLSKSAQKRKLRKERIEEAKAERKAERKRKRSEVHASKANVNLNDGTRTEDENTRVPRKKRKEQPKTEIFKASIIIDLGFDTLMLEKEIASLCNQLSYTYASNRRAARPFERIIVTSLVGQTKAKLESNGDGHTRWQNVEWHAQGYEQLWSQPLQNDAKAAKSLPEEATHYLEREDVIYLTADSSTELEELQEGDIYVLGGIVDHNRYKNLCLEKAVGQGIRTARLPIGRHMSELQTRKVLTVNQTLEVMLGWTAHKDWRRALEDVMPKRKLKGQLAQDDVGEQAE